MVDFPGATKAASDTLDPTGVRDRRTLVFFGQAPVDQQPQAPPQQPPPAGAGAELLGMPLPPPRPVMATVDRSFTVSPWPCGHCAGAAASAIGRLISKVSPQARQR
jgi:hypothetical protein